MPRLAPVEPIHLLSALLTSGERNISVIIERIGADPAQLSRATQEAIDRAPKVTGDGTQVGLRDLVRVLERAEKHARARWAIVRGNRSTCLRSLPSGQAMQAAQSTPGNDDASRRSPGAYGDDRRYLCRRQDAA